MSNKSLMISFLFLLLFPGCDWCSGSIITGFFDEPLDLSCNENNDTKQPIEKLIVTLHLRNTTDTTITKFVSYDGTKVCNEDHWLYNICLSQMTSYLTKDDNRAHFVIMNPPPILNNCQTYCAYEYKYPTTDSLSPGPVRTIKLRGRIKGYVGGRIHFNCSIPQNGLACNSLKVVLKFNNKDVKAVNITQSKNEFACVNHNSNRFYKVYCQEHMNLSYVNGSSVVFVLEKTPASLNNTELHCHVKFIDCVENKNNHALLETIIFLLYKQKETTATTAATATTATTVTTATAATTATMTPTKETTTPTKEGLTDGAIPGIIVIGCVAVLAAIAICVRMCLQQGGIENCGNDQEMSPMQPSNNEAS